MSQTNFQLYILINKDSALGYPFVGVSSDTKRVLNIGEEHINIGTIHKNDKPYFDEDYIATSRYFDFDLEQLDDLVENYIGQREYGLTAYFNYKKEISLGYRSVTDNSYAENDLSIEFPDDEQSRQTAIAINKLLSEVKELTFKTE